MPLLSLTPSVRVLYWMLALTGVFLVRSFYTVPFEPGGDATTKWLISVLLAEGGEWRLLLNNHHAARWGVNLPTALWVTVFGHSPSTYYELPLLLFSATFLLLVREVDRFAPRPAFIAFAVFLFFEPMGFRASSQLQPFAFGVFYLTLAAAAAIRFDRTGRGVWAAACGVLVFLAWGAKVTYVYFLPGIAGFLLLRGKTRGTLLVLGTFLCGVCLETLAFNALSDSLWGGRIEFLLRGVHYQKDLGPYAAELGGYAEYFGMWLRLPLYDRIGFVLFAAAAVLCFRRRGEGVPASARMAGLMVGSYLVLNTFLIVRTHPFSTPNPPEVKYLTPVIPFVLLFLAGVLPRLCAPFPRWPSASLGAATGLLACALVGFAPQYDYNHVVYPRPMAYYWRIDRQAEELRRFIARGKGVILQGKPSTLKMMNYLLTGDARIRGRLRIETLRKSPLRYRSLYRFSSKRRPKEAIRDCIVKALQVDSVISYGPCGPVQKEEVLSHVPR